ncbi:nuclear receptor coactivator 4 [Brachionichthys hirsutus]|uniref:nuclear receptor coactivator 4 n=1 Tax=Brachionichthys hirsutus TaxID=412623 RepID=UPI003604D399
MTSKVHIKAPRMPSAEAATGLYQCRRAQDQLEDAVSSVMKAEQQLRENGREVRAELQSAVSRQLEALRCREACLLGQVELLEQLKTETLQQQLHQLHWLRGQFEVIGHQLQKSSSSNDLNNQLTSCMEKLSSLSLTPEETPEMSFHGDTRSLRNAITSFGRITAQLVEGVSSHSPAQVQDCPISAKKQKTEAGPLDSWLLETPPTRRAPTGYQSSKNPQDWLVSNKENKASSPAITSMDFMQAWGQLLDLKAWLLQDHAPVSRERTESGCSSSFSIEKIDESDLIMSADEEEEELSDWLINPTAVATETASDAERWRRVFKPFEGSWSSSDWLLESVQCSSCCRATEAMEIENLGQLKCIKTPPTPTPTTLEAWLQQAVPLQQTCRANEVCPSYSDCVCEDNCGREALNLWLLRRDGCDKNGVPGAPKAPPALRYRDQEQKVQAILEAWLHPSTASSCQAPLQTPTSSPLSDWVAPEEKASSNAHSSSPLSVCHQTRDLDLWVQPQITPPPAQPRPSADEDKWLLKKRNQAQERLAFPTVCDLFSCMKVGGDKGRWLHKAPEQM